jgi:hypothetical protein
MLGILEMTIEEAKKAYLALAKPVFKMNALMLFLRGTFRGHRWDARKLEEQVNMLVEMAGKGKFVDNNRRCKV